MINGKKDVFQVGRHKMSWKYKMGSCKDFEEKESLMQAMDRKLGVSIDQTSKCHCKLAREGIKYS